MKRAPFYSNITERQRQHPAQSWRLIASGTRDNRWRRARSWNAPQMPGGTLLLPGDNPADVRWPCGTAIVDVTDAPAELVQRLAQALARDGVTHAVFIDTRTPARSFHAKVAPARRAA